MRAWRARSEESRAASKKRRGPFAFQLSARNVRPVDNHRTHHPIQTREIPSFSIHSRTHPLNVIISQSLYTGNSVFRFLFLRIDHDTRLTNQSERYTFEQIFSLPFSSNCKIKGKDLYSGNGCSILAIEAVLTHTTDFLPSKKIFKTRASISENEAVESDWLGEEGRASGDLQAKCK